MTEKKYEDNFQLSQKKTLTIKRSNFEHSTIKQNFSHGRTKAVIVETKKRKRTNTDEQINSTTVTKPHLAPRVKQHRENPPPKNQPIINNLSSVEMKARIRALEDAKILHEKNKKEKEEKKNSQESLKMNFFSQKVFKDEKNNSINLERKNLPKKSDKIRSVPQYNHHKGKEDKEEDSNPFNKKHGASIKNEMRFSKIIKGSEERRKNKLTVTSILDEDGSNIRGSSIAAMRRRQEKIKRIQNRDVRERISREVIIPETITIQELAQRMTDRSVDVIKFLMQQGHMMKPGDIIDADMAQLIAEEFGHTVKRVAESDIEIGIFNVSDDKSKMITRPPVVTIMGHVNHGKTSLLDMIRNTNIASQEVGGITQHIGAYQIEYKGKKITFIDTPGHSAFTAMRARGAKVTDIAVLVVAADDSVMPQTIESINHAKAAKVPIIVAINKIDKITANLKKVRNELLQNNVFIESFGGDVLEVEISAKTGDNINNLLDSILLQAEILDLKADPTRSVEGVVIEAKLDRNKGTIATVLVQKGTLNVGDIIIAGGEWGRVRALINEYGCNVKTALPSTPVAILGMQGPPHAGDHFAVVLNETQAREISEYRQRLFREKEVAKQTSSRGSLENMMIQLKTSDIQELSLIVKGDFQGSIEAISNLLLSLKSNEVQIRIIHIDVGEITEGDVILAKTSKSLIIGFNVRANHFARDMAEKNDVKILHYKIIYDLIKDINKFISGMLSPKEHEKFLGTAKVMEVFHISKIGKVAGCRVVNGKIERGSGARIIRNSKIIFEGKLKTLKHFKDEIDEVSLGKECGIAFENYNDLQVNDIIESFRIDYISRSFES